MLAACFGLPGLALFAFGVLLDPMSKAFGEPVSAISAWAIFMSIGSIAASPFIGYFADRVGARRLVLITLPMYALALAAVSMIDDSLWELYALAVVVGAVGTGVSPVTLSRVINSRFQAGRGTAIGLMSAGMGLSSIFGPPLMQPVVDSHGWRAGFLVMAASALIALPAVYFFLHEQPTGHSSQQEAVVQGLPFREAVRMPIFSLLVMALAVAGLSVGIIVNLVPVLSAQGLDRSDAAWFAGLLGLVSVVGRIAGGALIDRFHPAFFCAFLLCASAVAYVLLAAFPATFATFCIVIIGFAFGAEYNCIAYCIARYFGMRAYGAIYGLIITSYTITNGIAPVIFGWLHERSHDYAPALYASAGLAVAAAALFALAGRTPFLPLSPSGRNTSSAPTT